MNNNAWCSLDVIETLLHLSESAELYLKVRSLFKGPVAACPELVSCALVVVASRGPTLQDELLGSLMPLFLMGTHTHHSAVLHRLWALNPSVLVHSMAKLYAEDRAFLSRALDVVQDLKVRALPSSSDVPMLLVLGLIDTHTHLNLKHPCCSSLFAGFLSSVWFRMH